MESSVAQFEHLKIQIEAIKLATNDFSDDNCIGRGGFGKVYKGELVHSGGQSMVAFKRLNRALGQGDPEFWKEIMMLSFYKHPNIVSLVGYCDDSGEKILVYKYAQKGSLDLYLNSNELSWIRRLKICIGAARGLAYLHSPTGNQLRVFHRDIKSSNILLDENWDAKISDFGLSKFGPANQQFSFLVSNPVGTFGYWDPLYAETGLLTKESDVYSFGVVLFEVLCGRLCIGNDINKHRPLTGLARRCYEENKLQEIIHSNIKDEINPKSLKTFTKIAYQCLKRDRKERPLMTWIIDALETALNYQVGDAETMKRTVASEGEFYEKTSVERAIREAGDHVYAQGRARGEPRAVEKATEKGRQKMKDDVPEKVAKASVGTKSSPKRGSTESKRRAELARERATSAPRQRAESAVVENFKILEEVVKATFGVCAAMERVTLAARKRAASEARERAATKALERAASEALQRAVEKAMSQPKPKQTK